MDGGIGHGGGGFNGDAGASIIENRRFFLMLSATNSCYSRDSCSLNIAICFFLLNTNRPNNTNIFNGDAEIDAEHRLIRLTKMREGDEEKSFCIHFDISLNILIFGHMNKEFEDKDWEGISKRDQEKLDGMDDMNSFFVRYRRYPILPAFINDWREGGKVKSTVLSRLDADILDTRYVICPERYLAGLEARSLFVYMRNGEEAVYKMVEVRERNGYREMRFEMG